VEISLVAAVGGPLVGAACFVVAGRLARPEDARPLRSPPPQPTRPKRSLRRVTPVPATVRGPLPNRPDGMRGTLVLCNPDLDVERIVATLLRRFGSGVAAALDLEGALVALRRGANAVVCPGVLGAEELPATGWWPPTIVLGSTFVEAELRPVFGRAGREAIAACSSAEQADLDSEFERAFRYLDGLPRQPAAAERRTASDRRSAAERRRRAGVSPSAHERREQPTRRVAERRRPQALGTATA
jgi:hypothetical protein